MQQVNLHGPDDVRLDEVDVPTPGPRDALVRVAACGICGSDLGYIKLGGVGGPVRSPIPLGHELSGVIESVGDEVRGLAPGTRVVVNPMPGLIGNGGGEGAFAPYLLVRDAAAGDRVFAIPDGLSFERAALSEPLGVGTQAIERIDVQPGEKVVVFGAGPIGLTAVAALRQRGVEDVISVDLSKRRLEIAAKLGARAVLDPTRDDVWKRIRELHGTSPVLGAPMAGTDAYVEASGHGPWIGEIFGQAKEKARLSVVALHRAEIPVSFLLLMLKQLTVSGSIAYPDDYTRMVRMLEAEDLSPMITHRFPLERFHEALEVARDPAAGGKVLIEMTGAGS